LIAYLPLHPSFHPFIPQHHMCVSVILRCNCVPNHRTASLQRRCALVIRCTLIKPIGTAGSTHTHVLLLGVGRFPLRHFFCPLGGCLRASQLAEKIAKKPPLPRSCDSRWCIQNPAPCETCLALDMFSHGAGFWMHQQVNACWIEMAGQGRKRRVHNFMTAA